MSDVEAALLRANPHDYGADYRAHLFEQYRLFVESADRISSRRDKTNNFFLTVNTALVAFVGLRESAGVGVAVPTARLWLVLVAVAGFLLCLTWWRLILSYRQLNSAKFDVIHQIEARLPLAVYDAEWESLGRGRQAGQYRPFTRLEVRVPVVFAVLYLIGGVGVLLWTLLG